MRLLTAILLLPTLLCAEKITFKYTDSKPTTVKLAGEFNNWTPTDLTDAGGGAWSLDLDLQPGIYGYKLVINDEADWKLDDTNPAIKVINGNSNSALIIRGPEKALPPMPERDWADKQGRRIKAAFVSLDADQVTLTRAGQPVKLPLAMLSPEDAGYAKGWGEAMRLAFPPPPPRASFQGKELTSKLKFTFKAPLSDALKKMADKGFDGTESKNPDVVECRIGLFLPAQFDYSAKSWPIAIIQTGSGDDDGSSIKHMNNYAAALADAGWFVLAADPEPKQTDDHHGVRWAALAGALEALGQEWPASKEWPLALFAYSSGVWHGSAIAAKLISEKRDLRGIWFGACKEDALTPNGDTHKVSVKLHKTKLYLSNALDDGLVTQKEIKDRAESLRLSLI
ncbi:MAG: glycogen-binding domain-containing protein, partial [Prosthecobacter sp.]